MDIKINADDKRDLYIDEALVYERAVNRAKRCLHELRQERRKEKAEALKAGEKLDKSYDVLIDDLVKLRDGYQAESDRLWKLGQENFLQGKEPYEDLFNAIFKQAADDYEEALCTGDKSTIQSVRNFANGTKMQTILHKIDDAHGKFAWIVAHQGADIAEESAELKKHGKPYANGKHKCPLCGYPLYGRRDKTTGVIEIRCTGCLLVGRCKK